MLVPHEEGLLLAGVGLFDTAARSSILQRMCIVLGLGSQRQGAVRFGHAEGLRALVRSTHEVF